MAIGPDHALEQINRLVNATGGLFGITLNENARKRFFLISDDIVRLTEEANEMTRDSEAARKRHHELSQATLKRQTKNAQELVSTTDGFINPFSYQENDIVNLVTKAVILEKTFEHLGNNAKGSALNSVCLFKKCTYSNIKQSFRIKRRQRVICEN